MGSHHEELELNRMSWSSQITTPNMVGTTLDPAVNNTDTKFSNPNQSSCTLDFSYPLVPSRVFPSLCPISLSRPQLYHDCRTQSHVISDYLFMPWWWVNTEFSIHRVQDIPGTAYTTYSIHRVKHTLSTSCTEYSIPQVQYTPSTAYTKYSIPQVQHTPSTAYTKYNIHQVQHTPSTTYTKHSIHWLQHTPKIAYLPFNLMITSWPLIVASACGVPHYKTDRHQSALHESTKVKSPHHIPIGGS